MCIILFAQSVLALVIVFFFNFLHILCYIHVPFINFVCVRVSHLKKGGLKKGGTPEKKIMASPNPKSPSTHTHKINKRYVT